MNQWSRKDAEERFDELFEAALQATQAVMKDGKPLEFVLSLAEYERLVAASRAP